MKRSLLLWVPICFLAACNGDNHPAPITGLVDATEIDVASKIAGRIKELAVREGDRVTEGQKLVVIESEELAAKIDQVNALIDASKAKLRLAQKGARSEEKEATQKQLDAARHQLDTAQKMYDRMVDLKSRDVVPQAKFEEVELAYNMAKDQVSIAEARLSIVQSGAREEEIDALRALVKQGIGSLSEVESYQKETLQSAPIAGEISKVILHKGELAATGYPILTILDTSDLWVTFAVREDMLREVKTGDTIEAEIPALGKKTGFTIYHIAALGDFATWRATSEKNSFDLKSFEVKARPFEKIEGLRPGMTVRWYR